MYEPDKDLQKLYNNSIGQYFDDLCVDQGSWNYEMLKLVFAQLFLLDSFQVDCDFFLTRQSHLHQLLLIVDFLHYRDNLLVLDELIERFLREVGLRQKHFYFFETLDF